MGSAFDSELDRMHAAADADFGVRAIFRRPGGAPAPCRVEKLAPSPEFGFGKAKAVAPSLVLMVQVAALPARPQKGDVFDLLAGESGDEVASTLHVIGAATIDDDDGRRYTVKVHAP